MVNQKLYDKIIARILKDEVSGCWIWQGPGWYKRKSPGNRYGYVGIWMPELKKTKTVGTHKAMWWALHGRPEPGMCVCHECDNPRCVNPDHLWLGTHLQNMSDCRKKDRYHYANLTHCKRGHEFNEENTYYIKTPGPALGLRACRACQRGRLRLNAGWPEDLAYSAPPTPKGHRPVSGKFKRDGSTVTERHE